MQVWTADPHGVGSVPAHPPALTAGVSDPRAVARGTTPRRGPRGRDWGLTPSRAADRSRTRRTGRDSQAVVNPVRPFVRSARARSTQLRKADSVRSSSRATWPAVLPSSSTSRTAPARNSSVNRRRCRLGFVLLAIVDIVSAFRNVSTRSDQAQWPGWASRTPATTRCATPAPQSCCRAGCRFGLCRRSAGGPRSACWSVTPIRQTRRSGEPSKSHHASQGWAQKRAHRRS